ncbi:hypothetical protein [Neobacillus sp. LXY-1]|uniref:hypothetical protein n=1 Tax=Neobacillus sp. LXY-1 TaxID=3379133 RepID=UPI003EE20178
MSEEQKKSNKSILGDQLNLNSLLNSTDNNALMNLAGSFMQNPNAMNSLMKVASNMLSNDDMKNTGNDHSKQDSTVLSEDIINELKLVTLRLDKLGNELHELREQLKEFKEYNQTAIEYIIKKKTKSKKD